VTGVQTCALPISYRDADVGNRHRLLGYRRGGGVPRRAGVRMTALQRLHSWLGAVDPERMPFWPGAQCTGRMGLRSDGDVLKAGTSPYHAGVDRAGATGPLLAPFDGRLEWTRLNSGSQWGSFLRLVPAGCGIEIHVAHTDVVDAESYYLEGTIRRGDPLPVHAASLGLSTGVHTHTEVCIQCDPEIMEWLEAEGGDKIVSGGIINAVALRMHCFEHKLDYDRMYSRLAYQVRTWSMPEAHERWCLRQHMPEYREVPWKTATLLVDSLWLLKI